ncbi:MAG: 2Fe-2S iron-sulfur cluster-binding protein [Oligoflexales bacterium]
MPYLRLSNGNEYEVEVGTRLLGFLVRAKVPLKYGCASCRCGTCLIRVEGECSDMDSDEKELLKRMGFEQSEVRLACRLIMGDADLFLDLESQETLKGKDLQHDF